MSLKLENDPLSIVDGELEIERNEKQFTWISIYLSVFRLVQVF